MFDVSRLQRAILLMLILALTLSLPTRAADLAKISGTVVDKNGKPVSDASVDYYEFPNYGLMMNIPGTESKLHTTTDSAGAFSFSVPRAAANIVATKSGFAPAWKTIQSTPDTPLDPLVLTTPAVLAGVVVDDHDHPLANVEVSVSAAVDKSDGTWGVQPNYLFGKAAQQLFSARTASDGRFRIENFPAGAQANLDAVVPGRAMRSTGAGRGNFQMQVQAGQQDIKLVTDPAGSIEGKVVLRDSGAPIAGAKFRLQSSSPWGGSPTSSESIRSAADGSFHIPDLPAGNYTLIAISTNEPVPAWVTESELVSVTAGETSRNVLLKAINGGVVQVTVVGKDAHKAIPDVNVGAYGENYQTGATTGSNGVAVLRLPPGEFSLNAFKQGQSQAQTQTTVSDGQTNTETIELNSPLKITGILKDSSGAPLADTSVTVVPNYGSERPDAKSDSSGHYEITWELPNWRGGNQNYYLLARNYARNLASFHQVDESTKNLDLELKPAMSVSAHIQDPKGNAVTNAYVHLMLQTENFGFPISRQPAQSDQQGRIQVQTLPLGENYSLYITAKGYGSANQQMDNPNPKADHYDFQPITLNIADRKLSGRVLGTNGQPAAGVNVWMNGEGQPNGSVITDSDGRFTFDAVCAGPVSLGANTQQGLNANAQAMGGDTNVVIRFNRNSERVYLGQNSRSVSGTVYDTSGRPAVGAVVTVTPGWGMNDRAKTDENGEYKVSYSDQYGQRGMRFYVLARDLEHNLAGMEPLTTNSEHVSVHLDSGLSISGTVLDANGNPLTKANVYLSIMLGNMGGNVEQQPTKIASDGTFTIPALPPGQQYHLSVYAKDYGSAQKPISKAQSRTNSIELPPFKLRAADREIAGQVLDSSGKPMPGAWVNIGGNNQPNSNMRSDSNGHFKFKVCAGAITVNANSPNGGGPNQWGSTEARGGDMNVIVKFGQNPNQGRGFVRAEPLKPRPWSLAAFIAWPASHKTGVIVLGSLQTGVLLCAAGFVLWATRKRA